MRAYEETNIRSARPAELAAMLDLWARARSLPPSVPGDEATLATLLARDREGLLVAEHDGVVVGALIAAWDGWRGNLYRLAVVPDRHRHGIALKLVRFGEERLRARRPNRQAVEVISQHRHGGRAGGCPARDRWPRRRNPDPSWVPPTLWGVLADTVPWKFQYNADVIAWRRRSGRTPSQWRSTARRPWAVIGSPARFA